MLFKYQETNLAMNEIDQFLIKLVEKEKTPSVQYRIFDAERIIHHFQYGFSDIKNEIKADENTAYNAFSVTKTFTALAVLQLAEQKKIDIKKPAKKYLPEFPYSPEITILQLLTHSAGIPNPVPLGWIHLAEEHKTLDMDQFFRQIFSKNKKTSSGPNEKFAYSNLGYVLLGQLIEKVSGSRYEDFIRKNIIEPLNLKPNELDFKIDEIGQQAKGYHKKYSISNLFLGLFLDRSKFVEITEGKWISFRENYVNGAAYGGLIGTSKAFASYLQELLKPNCSLISDEFKKMLFTENYTNSGKATGMCLSWFKGELNGTRYFTHAGGGGGYYCELRIYPDLGIGSVLMFNRTGIRNERFLDKTDCNFI